MITTTTISKSFNKKNYLVNKKRHDHFSNTINIIINITYKLINLQNRFLNSKKGTFLHFNYKKKSYAVLFLRSNCSINL